MAGLARFWRNLRRAGSRTVTMPAIADLPPAQLSAVGAADKARDVGDWTMAATQYQQALAEQSDSAPIWVQLGHALKESNQLGEAEAAYRRALALAPATADTHLQLGHLLKMRGDRKAAIAAYAEAVALDPTLEDARTELVHLGGRDVLPVAATLSREMWTRLAAVGSALADADVARRGWVDGSAYPMAAYDRFRRDIPIRPPPGPLPVAAPGELVVFVDAVRATPYLVRETLRSLQNQSVCGWKAIVVAPSQTRAHPVASFTDVDPRILFVDSTEAIAAIGAPCVHLVSVTAGTALDPEALAWLLFAARRTRAHAVFTDHDHAVEDGTGWRVHALPSLPGLYDTDFAADPAIVMVPAALALEHMTRTPLDAGAAAGSTLRRGLLARAAVDGRISHVPRLLASLVELPISARDGRTNEDDLIPGRFAAVPAPVLPEAAVTPRDTAIAVIIPTRDGGAMLDRAIRSLTSLARDPGRLQIVIIDNGSRDDETIALLQAIAGREHHVVVPMASSFNWSRASNLGAEASATPLILFMNDDVEMTTQGWDDRLAAALARNEIGAVGARLLYPDGTVQHAGVVFGLAAGMPEHAGRGAATDDPGPGGRWLSMHSVASVTGAFFGVRRSDFDQVGGFDAQSLFVGHSDVDLCLKLREMGLRVLYDARIVATHDESKTRGRNETKAAVAWDEGERFELMRRWGTALSVDPSINPHWARGGVPFDGLREPSLGEIVSHIDTSAARNPWRPSRRDEQEDAGWRTASFAWGRGETASVLQS